MDRHYCLTNYKASFKLVSTSIPSKVAVAELEIENECGKAMAVMFGRDAAIDMTRFLVTQFDLDVTTEQVCRREVTVK